MIHRIVLLKFTDEFTDETAVAETADRARQVLPKIPGVVKVHVGLPSDGPRKGDWDLCFNIYLARLGDYEAYAKDEDHREFVDDFLMPRLKVHKAWNFEF